MEKVILLVLLLINISSLFAAKYEVKKEEDCTFIESDDDLSAISYNAENIVPDTASHITNAWGTKLHESPLYINLQAQTKYIWRGMEMQVEEASPVLFPSVGIVYKGFNAYFMGGYAINGKYSEVDLGASYTWKWLTIGFNDYYYPTIDKAEDNYYAYKSHETGHWLEGVITIAPINIPATLTISNFFAGADKNHDGKQAYSTYSELSTWYDFRNNHRLSATCGMALNKSCYNGYAHNCGVCNIEVKYTYNITFKNGSTLPLSCSYITNPVYKKTHVNFTANLTL